MTIVAVQGLGISHCQGFIICPFMKRVKQVVASFLLTFFYSFTLVSAFATVRIAPDVLEVEAGESIHFEATVAQRQDRDDLVYTRSIDGKVIDVETASLNLSRNEYLTYFPSDETNDSERAVSFIISNPEGPLAGDEAVLKIKNPLSADRLPLGIVWSHIHT